MGRYISLMQFALHRLRRSLAGTRLVIDLQHPGVDLLSTRLVAPAYPSGTRSEFPVLHPRFDHDDTTFEIHIESMAVIRSTEVQEIVVDLSFLDYDIKKALDRLVSGL